MNKNQNNSSYKIRDSYRQQIFTALIRRDPMTLSWGWKAKVDFSAGLHPMTTNRTFLTATEAEDHMRQSAYQCIDNRLG